MEITPWEKANQRLGKTASLLKKHAGGWEWVGAMGAMRTVFAMRAEGAAMALLHTEQIMEMGAMGVDGNGWELWEPSGRLGGMGIKKVKRITFHFFRLRGY